MDGALYKYRHSKLRKCLPEEMDRSRLGSFIRSSVNSVLSADNHARHGGRRQWGSNRFLRLHLHVSISHFHRFSLVTHPVLHQEIEPIQYRSLSRLSSALLQSGSIINIDWRAASRSSSASPSSSYPTYKFTSYRHY